VDDFCIIGGGIVGLASALALLRRRPGASLVLLEKEPALACHQSGRNSGVIHSGIYYVPGSLKARLCKAGAEATYEMCRQHGVPHERCGKLIVAANPLELERMDALERRAAENGIACERLDSAELSRREPMISGLGALFVPSTGIADYPAMCRVLAEQINRLGGRIELGARVTEIRETAAEVTIIAGEREFQGRNLVVCAGLQADRLARLAGLAPQFRIVPFRGDFYRLPSSKADVAKTLIYPVPDPALPFLGIHLTRTVHGSLTVGPNAVLAAGREAYQGARPDLRDLADMFAFGGTWKMLAANVRAGLTELGNALSRRRYLQACRKYCPSLELDDLLPHPPGIRAQAVLPDGRLVDDFLILESSRSLHVCNAPSPAATSALPIGEMIADRVLGGS